MSEKRGFGTVQKLPSGRYQARYTGPDGQRHPAPSTFEDRETAQLWLRKERALAEEPEAWVAPRARVAARRVQALTFQEYADAWLASRKVRGRPLADRTRDHYQDVLDRFINPTFGHLPLTAITPESVDRWYELVAIGRETTRAHAYGLLRTILNTAVDRGLIKTANPAKVRGGGSVTRRHKVTPATLEELATITAAMPDRRRLMIPLAAWCGLRFGEIAELRRSDVVLTKSAGVLKVRRGVVRVKLPGEDGEGEKWGRKVKDPKTQAGVRDVPIPPHLLGDIRSHLQDHTDPARDALLFPSSTGGHLSASAFYGRASTVISKGQDKGRITRKGHGWFEARRAAMRYQHAAADRMQDLAKRLSEIAGQGE
jgi:integrase